MFQCDKCGNCCRSIRGIPELAEFDLGDGVCTHLTRDNLCEIYNDRPLCCRIDDYYDANLSEQMSREEWYQVNKQACENIKKMRPKLRWLRHSVLEDANDFYFVYKGVNCGCEQTITNSIATYVMYYGDIKEKTYSDFEDVLNDPIFDGKALTEFLDEIVIEFC